MHSSHILKASFGLGTPGSAASQHFTSCGKLHTEENAAGYYQAAPVKAELQLKIAAAANHILGADRELETLLQALHH